jgi:predicted RNA-binding protein with RPS1 domain
VTVLEVRDGGLEVQAGDDGATGFIKRSDLGRDRDEQRPDRFQVGQKIDAMVTGFDRSKKPSFSIKARQLHEEGSCGTVRFLGCRRFAGRHPGRRSEGRQVSFNAYRHLQAAA